MTKANRAIVKSTNVALHKKNSVNVVTTTTKKEFVKRSSSNSKKQIKKYLEEELKQKDDDEYLPLSAEDTDEEIDNNITPNGSKHDNAVLHSSREGSELEAFWKQTDLILNNQHVSFTDTIRRKLSSASSFAIDVENDTTPEEIQINILNDNPIPPPPAIRYNTRKKFKKNELDLDNTINRNTDDKKSRKEQRKLIAVRTRLSTLKKLVETPVEDKDEETIQLIIPERTMVDKDKKDSYKESTLQEEPSEAEMLQELICQSETRQKQRIRQVVKSIEEIDQAAKEYEAEDLLKGIQDSQLPQPQKRKEKARRKKDQEELAKQDRKREEKICREQAHKEKIREEKLQEKIREEELQEKLRKEKQCKEEQRKEEERKEEQRKQRVCKGKRRQDQIDEEEEYKEPVLQKKVHKGRLHKEKVHKEVDDEVYEDRVYKKRLRRGRSHKEGVNEHQPTKEIILLKEEEEVEEKNIPSKNKKNKPFIITIPLNTSKYPSPPSPVNTITRSNSIRNDSPIEKSENGETGIDTAAIDIISKHGKQIDEKDLVVMDTILGEGQIGIVNLAKYRGLLVACKSKRNKTRQEPFYYQIQRELKYAADLSVCRYINRYFGWIYCSRDKVETGVTNESKKLYVIQKYIANGDARSYLNERDSIFHTYEAIQASICLFSALSDAHALGIGLVDLKLENFLIDSSGAGWLTDFGSCIEFYGRDEVDLDEEEVAWTTIVAAPEMIRSHYFSKASDVFMATLVVAELLTVNLSDSQFYNNVLRRRKSGDVNFSSSLIHRRYNCLVSVLHKGLANNSKDRPTASDILKDLIAIRNKRN